MFGSNLLVVSDMKIEGKVAVIIGGSKGIGKAIVLALLQKGAKVKGDLQ